MRHFQPSVERVEGRIYPTLVFVFPGNALAEAKPSLVTQLAADRLIRQGDRPIVVSTPALDSPVAFDRIANYVRTVSQGQPIGLMGFSAGGLLAMRLAGHPGLNVTAVMNYYGPPDLSSWLNYHRRDFYAQYVASHVQLRPEVVALLSGISTSNAYFVNAFGLRDHNVVSSVSTASFEHDYQRGQVFYYPGPHGVTLYACYPAFQDFLSHLNDAGGPQALDLRRP